MNQFLREFPLVRVLLTVLFFVCLFRSEMRLAFTTIIILGITQIVTIVSDEGRPW